jgi:hypothetical protein
MARLDKNSKTDALTEMDREALGSGVWEMKNVKT